MSRDTRKSLIEELEELRGSRVLTYVTSDRGPAAAQMANDAVRVIYDHVRRIGQVEKLDLSIYSRGGDINVPWRIASALRSVAESWGILVPHSANSAATLLALGADEMVLGPQAELGPIDPTLGLQRGGETAIQETVGVEDVMAYLTFVRERAGLSDQAALANSLAKLAERIDPVALGSIYRTHAHIREVAGRMLKSRKEPITEQAATAIIETLAERVYAHGHAISGREAKDMGLPVTLAEGKVDELMWNLLADYEAEMKIRQPVDPRAAVDTTDRYEEDGALAAVESRWALHEFKGTLQVEARRQVPPQIAINVNLNLHLPPLPQPVPGDLQQLVQQMMQPLQQEIAKSANEAVQQAVKAQAPLVGAEAVFKGGRWEQTAADDADGPASGDGDADGAG